MRSFCLGGSRPPGVGGVRLQAGHTRHQLEQGTLLAGTVKSRLLGPNPGSNSGPDTGSYDARQVSDPP